MVNHLTSQIPKTFWPFCGLFLQVYFSRVRCLRDTLEAPYQPSFKIHPSANPHKATLGHEVWNESAVNGTFYLAKHGYQTPRKGEKAKTWRVALEASSLFVVLVLVSPEVVVLVVSSVLWMAKQGYQTPRQGWKGKKEASSTRGKFALWGACIGVTRSRGACRVICACEWPSKDIKHQDKAEKAKRRRVALEASSLFEVLVLVSLEVVVLVVSSVLWMAKQGYQTPRQGWQGKKAASNTSSTRAIFTQSGACIGVTRSRGACGVICAVNGQSRMSNVKTFLKRQKRGE